MPTFVIIIIGVFGFLFVSIMGYALSQFYLPASEQRKLVLAELERIRDHVVPLGLTLREQDRTPRPALRRGEGGPPPPGLLRFIAEKQLSHAKLRITYSSLTRVPHWGAEVRGKNTTGLTFAIRRAGSPSAFIEGLGTGLFMPICETGDEQLDERIVVYCNDSEFVRQSLPPMHTELLNVFERDKLSAVCRLNMDGLKIENFPYLESDPPDRGRQLANLAIMLEKLWDEIAV